jgi:hypothetical protein
MMPKPIFVAIPGVFGKREQARIRASGYCFVEVDGPGPFVDTFKIVDTFGPIDSQCIFKSAMWAIANAGTNAEGPKTLFGRKLAEELSK